MDRPEGTPSDAETLAAGWGIAGPKPAGGSPTRRILYGIRRGLAALLRPQETFNAAVVRRFDALDAQSHALAAEARLAAEQAEAVARDGTAWSEAALEESRRIREAFTARERRQDDALTAVLETQQELRTAIGVLQRATQSLRRNLAQQEPRPTPPGAPAQAAPAPPAADDSHRYVGFEDQFRGDPEEIRARLRDYVPAFEGAADVLDLGCGRGEFLALLQECGVSVRGVDVNQTMIEVCRERGLDAQVGDGLAYLETLPEASLGGLFSAQVVEHLEPAYLGRLLDAAFDKLRPGAPIVLETINPSCWFAFFDNYIRDLTHVRPIHPDTLRYLLVASGFQEVKLRFRVPYPAHEKLQRLAGSDGSGVAETFNANVDRLNNLLFTYLDYAALGRRA